jgi:hypothetical protein
MRRLLVVALLLTPCLMVAGEKKLMHCFVFTPVESATQADWEAFFKATDELPSKIPGLHRVWYGKLLKPLTIFTTDAETRKKLAGGEKEVTGPVQRVIRQWGVCMEMENEQALKVYADHPAHKAWEQVYFKVRQPGTTTFDILGQ